MRAIFVFDPSTQYGADEQIMDLYAEVCDMCNIDCLFVTEPNDLQVMDIDNSNDVFVLDTCSINFFEQCSFKKNWKVILTIGYDDREFRKVFNANGWDVVFKPPSFHSLVKLIDPSASLPSRR